MKKTVLSLCDRTGNMLRPWAEAGFECIAVDIQHTGTNQDQGITYVGADIRGYLPPIRDYVACFAFPPCTHLAVSGARWFKAKGLSKLREAIEVVEACEKICQWTGAPYFIENPVSTLASYWREPDFKFDPCDYGGYLTPPGDRYTKKTCLWVGGGFQLPPKKPVDPTLGSKMHLMAPSPDRADKRSETPMGFSQAVFKQLTGMVDAR